MENRTPSLKQIEQDIKIALSILEDLQTKTQHVKEHITVLKQQIDELKIAQNGGRSNSDAIREGCMQTLQNIICKLPKSIKHKIQVHTRTLDITC